MSLPSSLLILLIHVVIIILFLPGRIVVCLELFFFCFSASWGNNGLMKTDGAYEHLCLVFKYFCSELIYVNPNFPTTNFANLEHLTNARIHLTVLAEEYYLARHIWLGKVFSVLGLLFVYHLIYNWSPADGTIVKFLTDFKKVFFGKYF